LTINTKAQSQIKTLIEEILQNEKKLIDQITLEYNYMQKILVELEDDKANLCIFNIII
jgi:hypothetical protein